MSGKPLAIVILDDTVKHLRATLNRRAEITSPAMSGLLCGLVGYWGRHRLRGAEFIHPGMAKMAKWAGCSERHARTLFTTLAHWAVIEKVAYAKGGRRSTRFVVRLEALVRALVAVGANPSPELVAKLRAIGNPELNPEVKGQRNPELFPETSSAGIQSLLERPSAASNVVPFKRRGDRS